jgi:phosphoribosylanthranilate isomerase
MTAVKICGFTQEQDVINACKSGISAAGFVLYAKSPRAVTIERAAELCQVLPPFVCPVLLFVNAPAADVLQALQLIPNALLQFHGDEDADYCEQFHHPFLKAARIPVGDAGAHFNWDDFFKTFAKAKGILLDSYSDAYGGSGHHFDWNLIPATLHLPIILGGGLTLDNVAHAMQILKNKNISFALDVSSGVEASKGIKDAEKMALFIKQVQKFDLDIDTK